MKKVFLDCGAWNGQSVKVFRQIYDPGTEYFIHSFEAHPVHLNSFPAFERHKLHSKAVWVEDCVKDFYLDYSVKRAGSTLIETKTSGKLDKQRPLAVECIDLDLWIKNNFDRNDYIILKLDIEGAEYFVLPHMISNGSIEYIDQLFIEWHWRKVGVFKSVHDNLIKQLNIPIKERWKVGYKK